MEPNYCHCGQDLGMGELTPRIGNYKHQPRPSPYPLLGLKYPLLGTIYPQLRVQGGSWNMNTGRSRDAVGTNSRHIWKLLMGL